MNTEDLIVQVAVKSFFIYIETNNLINKAKKKERSVYTRPRVYSLHP
jgi:hypothetical protein